MIADDSDTPADDRPVVVQLAMTSEKSWSETQVEENSAKYDEDTGDLRGPLSLAVAVERGATQKILDVRLEAGRLLSRQVRWKNRRANSLGY